MRNHAGGHHNHSLFWASLKKRAARRSPPAVLAAAIDQAFGLEPRSRPKFDGAAAGVFGATGRGSSRTRPARSRCSTFNQDSPLTQGATPLLGLDVGEHACYQVPEPPPEYVMRVPPGGGLGRGRGKLRRRSGRADARGRRRTRAGGIMSARRPLVACRRAAAARDSAQRSRRARLSSFAACSPQDQSAYAASPRERTGLGFLPDFRGFQSHS